MKTDLNSLCSFCCSQARLLALLVFFLTLICMIIYDLDSLRSPLFPADSADLRIFVNHSLFESLRSFYFANFRMRNAPRATITNTIAPIIKSGYLDWVNSTNIPAAITPKLTAISLEVNIILAFICT